MTAQMPDRCRFDDHEFSIAGISGSGLFDPLAHGINPVMLHTACWRGFIATYAVRREWLHKELRLAHLVIGVGDVADQAAATAKAPVIDGAAPQWSDEQRAVVYENLPSEIPFTGGLLLGDGFVPATYVHMGFHPAWKYERVVELIFENGRLVDDRDRSKAMAEIRQQIMSGERKDPTAEADDWIARSFELDYGRSE